MTERTWHLQDAKNRFSEVVDAAMTGEPQVVTRRGKPAVVVLSNQDYDRVKSALAKKVDDFVSFLLNAPKGDIAIGRVAVKQRPLKRISK